MIGREFFEQQGTRQSERTLNIDPRRGPILDRSALAVDGSDLIDVIPSFDGNEPVAARFQDGRQEVRLLDTGNPSRAKLAELLKAFPGQHVRITSSTRDGSKAIVLVDSDRNPGDYYLFETASLKADYLVGRSAWLDPDTMPVRQPIEFKARDGQRIRGYLTLPPGREAKGLPLIVHPHGGPFQIADGFCLPPFHAEQVRCSGHVDIKESPPHKKVGGLGRHVLGELRQALRGNDPRKAALAPTTHQVGHRPKADPPRLI